MIPVQKEARPTLGGDGKFSVMEIFRTVQGEGIDLGRETIFLRLSVCNLRCVWCDTKDSWTTKGTKEQLTVEEIVERFEELDPEHELTHYVITGGEPMLHNHELLHELQVKLAQRGWRYGTFETNGTILPSPSLQVSNWLFSVSPKLLSSMNGTFPTSLLNKWIWVLPYSQVQFKFVIANDTDALEVAGMLKELQDQHHAISLPIIFQPEESANNYRQLPEMMGQAFSKVGFKPQRENIRYIPQVHKMTGWH